MGSFYNGINILHNSFEHKCQQIKISLFLNMVKKFFEESRLTFKSSSYSKHGQHASWVYLMLAKPYLLTPQPYHEFVIPR